MTKRRQITPKMKVDTLLAQVIRQFGSPLVCPLSKIAMEPGDPVQFDHIHCIELDGPHEYQNLRAVLAKPHQKKTKADLRMIKKTRPGHADKFKVQKHLCNHGGYVGVDCPNCGMTAAETLREAGIPKRKIPSRPFDKSHRPFRRTAT